MPVASVGISLISRISLYYDIQVDPSNDGPASICSQITAKRVGADKMLTQVSVAAVRRDRVIA